MAWLRRAALLGIVLLSCLSCVSQAGKILVFTTPLTKSHAMNLKKIAEELSEERGHHITYVAMEQDVSTLQPTAHPLVTYRSKGLSKSVEIPEFRFKTSSTDADIWGPERGLTRLMEGACMGLMDNSTALALLKAFEADLMLAEMFNICTALLAHYLDVAWVNSWPCAPVEPHFTSLWPQSNRRLLQPNSLSYFPQHLSGIKTQHMNLWERLWNFYHYWSYTVYDWRVRRGIVLSLYKHYKFDPTLPEERKRLVLTITPVHWAAEWLRPVSPNFKMVGPILAGPGRPLPEHIETFMAEAHPSKQGVLLASFGTIAELDQQELVSMAADFAALPCKVLWRLTKKEVPDAAALKALNLSTSVQIATWVPQNDVLAHPNLRAFLSHVGINSMYEALYHGRPIIAVPFFGDQGSNADRVVAKGVGLQIGKLEMKSAAFRQAILAVLSEAHFTEAAKALSIRIKAQRITPVQEAADWVEHVLTTGGEAYLKTPEDELSFFVRSSFDVYAIVVSCCLISVWCLWKAVKLLIKRVNSLCSSAIGGERSRKKRR